MKQIEKASLSDGRQVEYVVDPDHQMEGGMKQVYFSPDKSYVLCFFKDQSDPTRRSRLEAVLGKYNPTIDSNPIVANNLKRLYCWPTGIVTSPRLGVMCPTYPQNFFFKEGPWSGKDKEGSWFTRKTGSGKPLRELLPESERGSWINYFRLCIMMARAIRRLHQAGLAHSDLSPRNILIDPTLGASIVIDIDSLVVAGIYPPDVMGTPGYIAPEVLATCQLPIKHPDRKHPCVSTDQHALPVLIYQYLLFRHPLEGPRINSTASAEEDDFLSMGSKALFIEHPTDHSNRPADKELGVTCDVLGPFLKGLFYKAFVDGLLHAPSRPIAAQWEEALLKTWDFLYPCPNSSCDHKWFVLHDTKPVKCPFCNTRINGVIYKLRLRKETRGNWHHDGELVIYHGKPICKFHVYDDIHPDEKLSDADREPLADCQFVDGRWLFINRKLTSLVSPGGNRVAPNTAIELKPGTCIHLSTEPHGRMAEVDVIQQ